MYVVLNKNLAANMFISFELCHINHYNFGVSSSQQGKTTILEKKHFSNTFVSSAYWSRRCCGEMFCGLKSERVIRVGQFQGKLLVSGKYIDNFLETSTMTFSLIFIKGLSYRNI